MLPVDRKLRGSEVIERVKSKGRIHQFSDFGVCIYKRGDGEPSNFGFIVSNKISKLAVNRNRIKRALNEAVRRNLVNIPVGYDVLFLVKKNIAKKLTSDIMIQVDQFFEDRSVFDQGFS